MTEYILVKPDDVDRLSYLDLNYWFFKGAKESPEIYDMISAGGNGNAGFTMWNEYEEDEFVEPAIFTKTNIFKVLYTEKFYFPRWMFVYESVDLFVLVMNESGDHVKTQVNLNPDTGDVIIRSNGEINGNVLLIGKNNLSAFPQFYGDELKIENWVLDENNNEYIYTIPHEKHNFVGNNLIDSILDEEGNLVSIISKIDPVTKDIYLSSQIPFSGNISLLDNDDPNHVFGKDFNDNSDWVDNGDGSYSIQILSTEHNLVQNKLFVYVRDLDGNNVGSSIKFSQNGMDVTISSNTKFAGRVIISSEDEFFYANAQDLEVIMEPDYPHSVIIRNRKEHIFKWLDIEHKVRQISRTEFDNLPKNLKYLLDTHFNVKSLWITTVDPDDIHDSILIEPEDEYNFLIWYRDLKQYYYEMDELLTELPMTLEDFEFTYFNNFDNLTPLGKAMAAEIYYIFYDQNDDFEAYKKLLDLIPTYEQVEEKKSYYTMTLLYTYMVVNKILKRKVIDQESNLYPFDYWSIDQ